MPPGVKQPGFTRYTARKADRIMELYVCDECGMIVHDAITVTKRGWSFFHEHSAVSAMAEHTTLCDKWLGMHSAGPISPPGRVEAETVTTVAVPLPSPENEGRGVGA